MQRARSFRSAPVIVAIAGCALVVVVLAAYVTHAAGTTALDRAVGPHLRAAEHSTRERVATWVGWGGSPVAVISFGVLGAAVSVWPLRRPLLAIVWLGGPALAGLVTAAAKPLVGRPAPAADGTGWSFPSGHTAGAAAIATALVVVVFVCTRARSLRVVGALVATGYVVGVAVARIEVGAHYPTDVIGGCAVGTAAALSVAWAVAWAVATLPLLQRARR